MTIQNKIIEGVNYFSLVGDPCYRFSRIVKERFFNDVSCAYLFKMSTPRLKEILNTKGENRLFSIIDEL